MNQRITAIDSLRGLMIILMILGHLRWLFLPLSVDPIEIDAVPIGVYLTRVMTNMCAPIFFFLSGMSIFLLVKSEKTLSKASRSLLIRGFFLIAVDLTFLSILWNPPTDVYVFGFNVIWMLAVGMLTLSIFIHLPIQLTAGVAILILLGHNALDHFIDFSYNGSLGSFLLMLLHGTPTIVEVNSFIHIEYYYAIVPWFAVMLLGYVLAHYLLTPTVTPAQRQRFLLCTGLSLLGTFIVLRTLIGYGDAVNWSWMSDGPIYSLLYLFKITKYPPSLQYLCLALGVGCLLFVLMDRFELRAKKYLIVFGQTPLFIYLLHFPVLVLAAHLWEPIAFGPQLEYAKMPAVSLPWIYLIWFAFLPLFYWACKWYRPIKIKYKHTVLKYI